MWKSISKNDRPKLIYSYVVYLLMYVSITSFNIMLDLEKQGYNHAVASSVSNKFIILTVLLGYCPVVLPPTIIRFVYFRRDLNYGLEVYVSMIISEIISVFIFSLSRYTFMFFSSVKEELVISPSLSLFDEIAIYCILSYGARQLNTISRKLRYTLTFVTLAVPFILPNIYI